MVKFFLKGVIASFLLLISLISLAQSENLEFDVKSQTLSVLQICELLEKKTDIKIAYNNKDEQLNTKIVINEGKYTLNNFLFNYFKKNGINYKLSGQQLIIIHLEKNIEQAKNQKKKITISGFVEDSATGEKLPGATIFFTFSRKGTVTNNYGFYTVTLDDDPGDILVSYIGYQLYQYKIGFENDLRLNIKLQPEKNIQEVVVKGSKTISLQQQTQMSKISVPISFIKSMPRFLGETDVLKTLQLLPGVSQAMEGTGGLVVRGGTPDQNLILLDGVPVYNASHVFGVFSTFNSNALKNLELYKGGFPARFGSRLSSVVDIITKDGNMKSIHGEGSIGLLAANLTLEGPVKKDKSSFLIAGRRSYLDLLIAPILKSGDNGIKKFAVYFYDFNVKFHQILSDKDRLFFSFYNGNDFLKTKYVDDYKENIYTEKGDIGWGNNIGTIRWNHIFNKKLFSNTTINYTRYRFLTQIEQSTEDKIDASKNNSMLAKYYSAIYDLGGRIDFDYRPEPAQNIKFGAYLLRHKFTPGASTLKLKNPNSDGIDTSFNESNQASVEASIYGENDWKISSRLKANIGFHASLFQAKTKWYPSLQPRIGIRYLLPYNIALKAAYTQMSQFIHLLTNNATTLPTDLWVPSTDKIKPMLSHQIALGLARSFFDNKFDISIETYYKTMNGVIEYKEGASYLSSSAAEWDTKVEAGNGTAYGLEILLQKNVGKTKGWIGYTLAKSYRKFPTINDGKQFDYKYDRRHDFEIVITHNITKRLEISGSWVFQTGSPLTLPTAQFEGPSGEVIEHIKGRNEFRLLNYHRLDFGITWKKQNKNFERSWNLSLYNAYNRANPFYYYVSRGEIGGKRMVKGLNILPILPSISYSIKF